MTVTALSAAHPAPTRLDFAVALIVAIPVILYLLHRIGDIVPGLIFFALAALAIFMAPKFPGSPVACIQPHHGTCGPQQAPWLIGLVFVGPAFAMVIYKFARGDKRGVNGRRLP